RKIRQKAEAGDAGAQCLMSFAAISPEEQITWLSAAADQNHPEACYLLYFLGHRDEAWMLKAAALGWADAQVGLGVYYATLPEPNLAQSRHWYLQAALQGQAEAMYEIGFELLLGEGGPADPVQALEWLEKSAQADEHTYTDDVRRLLTQLYTDGTHGIAKDPKRAR
ncbi:unnamed protein product, partial [Phaeothamnion confervicola]